MQLSANFTKSAGRGRRVATPEVQLINYLVFKLKKTRRKKVKNYTQKRKENALTKFICFGCNASGYVS